MSERRNVGRIDHVVMVYRIENSEQAVRTIERMLDIAFSPPQDLPNGLRAWINFDAGLEVVSPLGTSTELGLDGPAAALVDSLIDHLERRGEGLFSIVFGVRDMDSALNRLRDLSITPGQSVKLEETGTPSSSSSLYEKFEEVELGWIDGVYWWLSEIVPANTTENSMITNT